MNFSRTHESKRARCHCFGYISIVTNNRINCFFRISLGDVHHPWLEFCARSVRKRTVYNWSHVDGIPMENSRFRSFILHSFWFDYTISVRSGLSLCKWQRSRQYCADINWVALFREYSTYIHDGPTHLLASGHIECAYVWRPRPPACKSRDNNFARILQNTNLKVLDNTRANELGRNVCGTIGFSSLSVCAPLYPHRRRSGKKQFTIYIFHVILFKMQTNDGKIKLKFEYVRTSSLRNKHENEKSWRIPHTKIKLNWMRPHKERNEMKMELKSSGPNAISTTTTPFWNACDPQTQTQTLTARVHAIHRRSQHRLSLPHPESSNRSVVSGNTMYEIIWYNSHKSSEIHQLYCLCALFASSFSTLSAFR